MLRKFAAAALVMFCFSAVAHATPVTTGSVTYTGTEGPFNNSGLAGTVPANLALNPLNSPALPQGFADSVAAGGTLNFHQIPHLNDGSYSNSRSWIGDLGAGLTYNVTGVGPVANQTFAGIDLKGSYSINSFAFGSDNGNYLSGQFDPNRPANTGDPNENLSGPDTGAYHDRTNGTYYIQYTTVANPSASTPDASWATLGTVALVDGTLDSYRHLYGITGSVTATGIRLVLPAGDRIDEIELYGSPVPEPSTIVLLGAGLAGLALVARRRRSK